MNFGTVILTEDECTMNILTVDYSNRSNHSKMDCPDFA